jgi:hypothetical protein
MKTIKIAFYKLDFKKDRNKQATMQYKTIPEFSKKT